MENKGKNVIKRANNPVNDSFMNTLESITSTPGGEPLSVEQMVAALTGGNTDVKNVPAEAGTVTEKKEKKKPKRTTENFLLASGKNEDVGKPTPNDDDFETWLKGIKQRSPIKPANRQMMYLDCNVVKVFQWLRPTTGIPANQLMNGILADWLQAHWESIDGIINARKTLIINDT